MHFKYKGLYCLPAKIVSFRQNTSILIPEAAPESTHPGGQTAHIPAAYTLTPPVNDPIKLRAGLFLIFRYSVGVSPVTFRKALIRWD